jgi:AraC family transcriptional regulator, regulatory protein of adaptative response / methylated-DNA-[protein]-cysteine methyltransferase
MRESIRFAWGSSSLGDFVVAMSKNGIVAVEFSSMHSATEEALSIRFPDAEFRRSRHELADVTGLLARLIDDPTIHCELPIDLRGTPFGVRIWLMLRETPAGRTTTYSVLARKFRMRVCISGPIHAFVRRRELQKR